MSELEDKMQQYYDEHKDEVNAQKIEPNPPCQVSGCPGPRPGQSRLSLYTVLGAWIDVWVCKEHIEQYFTVEEQVPTDPPLQP